MKLSIYFFSLLVTYFSLGCFTLGISSITPTCFAGSFKEDVQEVLKSHNKRFEDLSQETIIALREIHQLQSLDAFIEFEQKMRLRFEEAEAVKRSAAIKPETVRSGKDEKNEEASQQPKKALDIEVIKSYFLQRLPAYEQANLEQQMSPNLRQTRVANSINKKSTDQESTIRNDEIKETEKALDAMFTEWNRLSKVALHAMANHRQGPNYCGAQSVSVQARSQPLGDFDVSELADIPREFQQYLANFGGLAKDFQQAVDDPDETTHIQRIVMESSNQILAGPVAQAVMQQALHQQGLDINLAPPTGSSSPRGSSSLSSSSSSSSAVRRPLRRGQEDRRRPQNERRRQADHSRPFDSLPLVARIGLLDVTLARDAFYGLKNWFGL